MAANQALKVRSPPIAVETFARTDDIMLKIGSHEHEIRMLLRHFSHRRVQSPTIF